jgi:nucleoside-diphosphate-sugar epimerase
MIYGAPGDRNLSRLLAVLARAPMLPVPGGGRHLQQPVQVADVADAVLAAADLGYAPRPFAIGMRAEAQAMGPAS